jgi:hypothetical protein
MTNIAEPPVTALEHRADERSVRLQEICGTFVHVPGDRAYDDGRRPWNLAAHQLPAAVAVPETVAQIGHLVRVAADLGLRLTVQTTGHAAAVLAAHRLDDVVLVRTTRLRGVFVDAAARTARVEGGAVWQDVIDAAGPYGLAAPHGSSGGVGVAGYTLGGGLSWYARKFGLATNSITAIELVNADGEVVRADARTNPDLFWAARGGGGNFGVVTALEIALQPIADAVAGMLVWDVSRAEGVLQTWADWCATAPDEVTTSFRIMRFPPLPQLPEFLRGRSLVIIDGVAVLEDEEAGELLAPLRALAPEMDTFGRVPATTLGELHMDPHDPTPAVGAGTLLAELGRDVIEAFLGAVGPESDTDLFLGRAAPARWGARPRASRRGRTAAPRGEPPRVVPPDGDDTGDGGRGHGHDCGDRRPAVALGVRAQLPQPRRAPGRPAHGVRAGRVATLVCGAGRGGPTRRLPREPRDPRPRLSTVGEGPAEKQDPPCAFEPDMSPEPQAHAP